LVCGIIRDREKREDIAGCILLLAGVACGRYNTLSYPKERGGTPVAEEHILNVPSSLAISTEDADRLLTMGSGDAVLLYLWLLKNGGRFDPDRAARELKTVTPIPVCLDMLRRAGLIKDNQSPVKAAVPPEHDTFTEYTVEEEKQGIIQRFRKILW